MVKPSIPPSPRQDLCAYWPNSGKVTEMHLDMKAPRGTMPDENWRREKFNQLAMGRQSTRAGMYHPVCPTCPKTEFCRATRINLSAFDMSPSQRKKQQRFSSEVTINIVPPHFDRDIFELYKHSVLQRHGGTSTDMHTYEAEDFKNAFGESRLSWIATARNKQDKHLVAAMFLDSYGDDFLAEYVVHNTEANDSKLSPGISMMLTVLNITRASHPDGYMYLGSWSPRSPTLGYKSLFRGLEVFKNNKWKPMSP